MPLHKLGIIGRRLITPLRQLSKRQNTSALAIQPPTHGATGRPLQALDPTSRGRLLRQAQHGVRGSPQALAPCPMMSQLPGHGFLQLLRPRAAMQLGHGFLLLSQPLAATLQPGLHGNHQPLQAQAVLPQLGPTGNRHRP